MPKRREGPPEPWWVQRWLALLDIYGAEYRVRTTKGRSYFNTGRIFDIAVHPGRVCARAYGSYGNTYRLHLDVPQLSDDAWRRVVVALASRADYVALLLGGELPAALEAIFAGAALFPEPGTLTGDCTCLDWSYPCKHVFGLYYGFATLLRSQPSLLFELRGRSREDLLRVVQRAWAGAGEMPPAPPSPVPASAEPPGLTAPLRLDRFFTASAPLDTLDTPITPLPPEFEGALIHWLGRPPFASATEDLLTPLALAYAAVSRRAVMNLKRSAAKSLLRDG